MKSMVDFDNFTEQGLKKVTARFKKADLPVSEVKANNRAVRKSGFLTKSATLVFESGQKLFVAIKANGGVYQIKLNGMVIPVKNYLNEAKALKDLIQRVKKNEAVYLKNRAKRMAKAADAAVKKQGAGKKRKPSLSLARQIEEKEAEAAAMNEELETMVESSKPIMKRHKDAERKKRDLDKKISDIHKEEKRLEKQVRDLKSELRDLK